MTRWRMNVASRVVTARRPVHSSFQYPLLGPPFSRMAKAMSFSTRNIHVQLLGVALCLCLTCVLTGCHDDRFEASYPSLGDAVRHPPQSGWLDGLDRLKGG